MPEKQVFGNCIIKPCNMKNRKCKQFCVPYSCYGSKEIKNILNKFVQMTLQVFNHTIHFGGNSISYNRLLRYSFKGLTHLFAFLINEVPPIAGTFELSIYLTVQCPKYLQSMVT